MLIPLTDLLATPPEEPAFLLKPYVPTRGVVLLHGKGGVGKTPFTYQLAKSIATGTPFISREVQTKGARVLYIENDTPRLMIHHRLASLPPPYPARDRFLMLMTGAFDLAMVGESRWGAEIIASVKYEPELVVVNTLNKVMGGRDGNNASVPPLIYGKLQELYPKACIWVVHHDVKEGMTPPPGYKGEWQPRSHDEASRGSLAFRDDAVAAIRIVKVGWMEERKAWALNIVHHKSQVSALEPVWRVYLGEDGMTFTDHGGDLLTLLAPHVERAPAFNSRAALIRHLQRQVDAPTFGIPTRTVRGWLLQLEDQGIKLRVGKEDETESDGPVG